MHWRSLRVTDAVRRLILLVAILSGAAGTASAAEETGFLQRVYRDARGEHKYVVYVPDGYTADRAWPVILFLHGAGERGNDGLRHTKVGLGPMISRWSRFPWIVVFPQAEDERGAIINVWAPESPDGARALKILAEVESSYNTDPQHRVLTGWSMGGRGTYMMAAAYPDMWKAAVPVSGWANTDLAPKLANVPLWAFHGTADSIVAYPDDVAIIDAIREAGGKPLFTSIEGEGHYAWRKVYADPNTFRFLSDPTQFTEPPTLEPIPEIELSLQETDGPFIPALELKNAAAIWLGTDVFADLSEALSREIVKTPMSGSLPGMPQNKRALGINFRIQTGPITYRVSAASANITPTERRTILVDLGISQARLTITRTTIAGLLCRGTAGPMTAIIGHRRPVPVQIEAVPYIDNGVFRVRPVQVQFTIPNDNWVVTRPVVHTNTPLLPEGRVAKELVEGLFESKGRIEREFRQSITKAVAELEFELPAVSGDQLITSLWPIPVYRPRVRPRPHSIQIFPEGLGVIFDLTVAALEPKFATDKPEEYDFGLTVADAARGDLTILGAHRLIEPLSKQLVEANVTHINVLDVPNPTFRNLNDREVLAEAIPALLDLPKMTKLRVEIALRKPLELETDENPEPCMEGNGEVELLLHLSDLAVIVSVQETPDALYRDFAEFSFTIRQPISLKVGNVTAGGRDVVTACSAPPQMVATGRWLTEQPPMDDRLETAVAIRLFQQAWLVWADVCGPTLATIPDLSVRGYSRRLAELLPGPKGIGAVFNEPLTVIENQTDVPLVYHTRRLDGPLGPELTLPPGQRHEYAVSIPVGYESRSPVQQTYAIPAGRRALFKPDPPRLVLGAWPAAAGSAGQQPQAPGPAADFFPADKTPGPQAPPEMRPPVSPPEDKPPEADGPELNQQPATPAPAKP